MRRFLAWLLLAALLVTLLPMGVLASQPTGMSNFTRNGKYHDGLFRDVAAGEWYRKSVAAAYELGMMKGDGGHFSPDGNVTLAEAVTIAVRMHSIYTTGKGSFKQGSPWYQVYVDYAVENGILGKGEFPNLTRAATRAEMAHIFAAALPEKELEKINAVNSLPDVKRTTRYRADILRLYCAGVLTGNDEQGTFAPNASITRAEAAAIIARMAQPSQRKTFTLESSGAYDPEPKLSSNVTPLSAARTLKKPQAVGGVKPYSEYYWTNQHVSADLSDAPALAYSLTISDRTTFSGLPAGYDPSALLEWGKDSGLNVDILHQYGFTGKGATIAYIDQPISSHAEYASVNLHYTNTTWDSDSMHGPMVLSLLAGKNTGTAPEAEVYFYGHGGSESTCQLEMSKCLYKLIEQNKMLPEDQKISMVGFSNNVIKSRPYCKELQTAVDACTEAGIMVWFCGEYITSAFLPMSDKNNPDNLVANPMYYGEAPEKLVHVPASGRTGATNWNGGKYIYWGESGGLSWTMPYVLGLYAIVNEIDPSLSQDDLRSMIVDTAYHNSSGMRIVNPVGFVAEALRGVGREGEAQQLEEAVLARQKYLYAVMDTAALSEEDLRAIRDYLARITDATVLVADAAAFSGAKELYAELQADAAARGGTVAGVQIFGTAAMVPAFAVQYKVQMQSGVDEGGTFLTDLFYGNFNNDPQKIASGYNVLDHFAQKWTVDLLPDWPVARLPLEKGEFKAFLDKYRTFMDETALEQQTLVNVSNPIFNSSQHVDDMSAFLKRMDNEFGLLDVPYRLYGNKRGSAPVKTTVLGDFSKANLAAENDKGMMELLINSHGQQNNIDQCYFENGVEKRESFLNSTDINSVLDGKAYYLDCWTCNNGYGMADNLTTTALNGKCVGVFSATTVISNNGVNWKDSLAEMKKSNFYYFYYSYLKALHDGMNRSQAFCAAQQAYGAALLADSKNGIRNGEGNYQFNLCNLLAYHNFGLIEPNAMAKVTVSDGAIAQSGQRTEKGSSGQGTQSEGTQVQSAPTQYAAAQAKAHKDAKPVGAEKELSWTTRDELKSGSCTIHSYTAQKLDDGYIRFTITYTARKGLTPTVFNPPNGSVFMISGETSNGEKNSLVFYVKEEDLSQAGVITINFYLADDDRLFVIARMTGV